MLAEGEYNPSQGTSSKNDEKDQNHYVPPEMEPAVFLTIRKNEGNKPTSKNMRSFMINF